MKTGYPAVAPNWVRAGWTFGLLCLLAIGLPPASPAQAGSPDCTYCLVQGAVDAAIDVDVGAGIATGVDGQFRPSGSGYNIGSGEYYIPPEPGHVAFLPLVRRSDYQPPPAPSVLIFDKDGVERDWAWLIEKFGAVTLAEGDGSARVRVLQEVEGTMALVAHVEQGGQPVVNYPVMFYWPDAPMLDPGLQACGKEQALVILTKENGNAELEMGPQSYYFPPEGGPYVVWVGGPGSDCLGGLGWLGQTNHIHLDSEWELP